MVTGEPHIRFYAGVPLQASEEMAYGTLCVIDREPRKLSPEQAELLRALGRQVSALIELHIANGLLRSQAIERRRMLDNAADVVMGLDSHGRVLYANAELNRLLGERWSPGAELWIQDLADEPSKPALTGALEQVTRGRVVQNLAVTFVAEDGDRLDMVGSLNADPLDARDITVGAVFRLTPSSSMAAGRSVDFASVMHVCSWCRSVRDGASNWQPIDQYLDQKYGVPISHGICESCETKVLSSAGIKKPG